MTTIEQRIKEFKKSLLTKKIQVKKVKVLNKRQIRNNFLLTKKDDILQFSKDYKKTHNKLVPLTELRKLSSLFLVQENILDVPFTIENRSGKKQLKCIVTNKDILGLFSKKTERNYLIKEKKGDTEKKLLD